VVDIVSIEDVETNVSSGFATRNTGSLNQDHYMFVRIHA
jgi:hypothetical protein